ncbi:MAG: DUF2147 domain-containing protein [Bacteroidales bacterium]|jgi:uncharacterized protein (DUF2147 family)|nr:DUF2147 domain-containing protein [Bacteroidales bacterium]
MKQVFFAAILGIGFLLPSLAAAQTSKADRISGIYLTYDDETGKEKSQVKIHKASNGRYVGEIVWLKEPKETNGKEKLDKNNPETKLQSRKIMGLQILKDFTYDAANDEWSGGTIYNPSSGKTYNCYMKFESGKSLKIRGYIGKAWMGLGKTAVWTKEETIRK